MKHTCNETHAWEYGFDKPRIESDLFRIIHHANLHNHLVYKRKNDLKSQRPDCRKQQEHRKTTPWQRGGPTAHQCGRLCRSCLFVAFLILKKTLVFEGHEGGEGERDRRMTNSNCSGFPFIAFSLVIIKWKRALWNGNRCKRTTLRRRSHFRGFKLESLYTKRWSACQYSAHSPAVLGRVPIEWFETWCTSKTWYAVLDKSRIPRLMMNLIKWPQGWTKAKETIRYASQWESWGNPILSSTFISCRVFCLNLPCSAVHRLNCGTMVKGYHSMRVRESAWYHTFVEGFSSFREQPGRSIVLSGSSVCPAATGIATSDEGGLRTWREVDSPGTPWGNKMKR